MAIINIRVSDEELNILKRYACIHNTNLSSIIRKTIMEHVEDEYERAVFSEYEENKAKGNIKTRPIDELWKDLNQKDWK